MCMTTHINQSRWSQPTTPPGRWARNLAGLAVTALLVANVAASSLGWFRGALIMVFAACSAAALVAAIQALRRADRSLWVWSALIIGALGTVLMIAEFTVME